jgi:hypothetical protein
MGLLHGLSSSNSFEPQLALGSREASRSPSRRLPRTDPHLYDAAHPSALVRLSSALAAQTVTMCRLLWTTTRAPPF